MSADYTPQQVSELIASGDVQLVDVRTPEEHDAGHIPGDSAIELTELAARAGELDRSRPVIFYCRGGSRSAMATAALAQAGFDAHNMTGGMLEWHAAGLAMEPADGYVAEH